MLPGAPLQYSPLPVIPFIESTFHVWEKAQSRACCIRHLSYLHHCPLKRSQKTFASCTLPGLSQLQQHSNPTTMLLWVRAHTFGMSQEEQVQKGSSCYVLNLPGEQTRNNTDVAKLLRLLTRLHPGITLERFHYIAIIRLSTGNR